MYDRILVPTDGSEEGERAVAHAIRLAAAHDATLSALYVVNTASFTTMPVDTGWEGVGQLLRDDGEAALERVRELAHGVDLTVETHIREGSPSREVVRFAEDCGADLIVMGTHGRGGIDRLLLGSVAEKVVRSSRVPVLTVRVDEGTGEEPVVGPEGGAAEPADSGEVTTEDGG